MAHLKCLLYALSRSRVTSLQPSYMTVKVTGYNQGIMLQSAWSKKGSQIPSSNILGLTALEEATHPLPLPLIQPPFDKTLSSSLSTFVKF